MHPHNYVYSCNSSFFLFLLCGIHINLLNIAGNLPWLDIRRAHQTRHRMLDTLGVDSHSYGQSTTLKVYNSYPNMHIQHTALFAGPQSVSILAATGIGHSFVRITKSIE